MADVERLGLRPPRPVDTNAPITAQRLWHVIAGFEMFTSIFKTSPNPMLPIGRFLKSESLGGNRVILAVRQ